MSVRDGGPAFARPASEYTAGGTLADGNDAVHEQDGMSLRDAFALGVVSGWGEGHHGASINMAHLRAREAPYDSARDYAGRMAFFAYMVADAMLEARKGNGAS